MRHSGRAVREGKHSRRRAADGDPFGALGLPRAADLSDDDVRAAWRRVAAAAHPDRDDGGDPARFGAAAAAYATLRTAYGRGEARADLADRAGQRVGMRDWLGGPGQPGVRGRRGRRERLGTRERLGAWRRRGGGRRRGRGRVGVLALRVAAAAAVSAVAFAAAGWSPAFIGLLAGAVTWLVATGRHDLPPRARGSGADQRRW
jgi:hypothetical protein